MEIKRPPHWKERCYEIYPEDLITLFNCMTYARTALEATLYDKKGTEIDRNILRKQILKINQIQEDLYGYIKWNTENERDRSR